MENNYSEFVKTIFAYTYKKYRLTSDKEQQSKVHFVLNPIRNEVKTYDYTHSVTFELLGHLQDLQHKHDIIHCAYGILNEYVEYLNEFHKYGELVYKASELPFAPVQEIDAQEIAVLKEIGDIYYYKTMLFNLLGLTHTITDIQWCSEEGPHIEIIGDLIKKYIYYGHEFDAAALMQASYDLDRCFNFICFKFNTTLPDIISQNEAKLRKRYPSGTFTSQEAAAKADKNG